MVTLYEQPSAFGGQGEPVTLAQLQDDSSIVLLGPSGEFLYSRNVRWVEIDIDGLDPTWAETLADLDQREQDLNNTISWVTTALPHSEDRDDFVGLLQDLLNDVPYAREMIELEMAEEAAAAEVPETV